MKAQKFRQKVFRENKNGLDEDKFDRISDHCLIFDKKREHVFITCKDILWL